MLHSNLSSGANITCPLLVDVPSRLCLTPTARNKVLSIELTVYKCLSVRSGVRRKKQRKKQTNKQTKEEIKEGRNEEKERNK
jgi:hypothetical protein